MINSNLFIDVDEVKQSVIPCFLIGYFQLQKEVHMISKNRNTIKLIIFLFILWIDMCLVPDAKAFGQETNFIQDIDQNQENLSQSPQAFSTILQWYRKYISPIDGDRCPMYPSCSTYSEQSFRKYGWFKGWIMTCDRLMRCGRDEIHMSPMVRIENSIKCYDPPEQNDLNNNFLDDSP